MLKRCANWKGLFTLNIILENQILELRNEIDLSDRFQLNKTGKRKLDSPVQGEGVKRVGWWWGGCLQTCTRFPTLVGVRMERTMLIPFDQTCMNPVVVLLLDILRREVQERVRHFWFSWIGLCKRRKNITKTHFHIIFSYALGLIGLLLNFMACASLANSPFFLQWSWDTCVASCSSQLQLSSSSQKIVCVSVS